MNEINEKTQGYSIGAGIIIALFGTGWLLGFEARQHHLFIGQSLGLIIIFTLGNLSYLFLLRAYQDKTPYWLTDQRTVPA